MKYVSTRSDKYKVESAEAIKTGIAPDGGLFVPEEIPQLSLDEIEKFANLSYPELAKKILSLYLTDYTEEELSDCVNSAYTSEKFESEAIAPLHKLDDKAFVLELWHG
ncbi:MAG: threonine synthase, partial [Clostridia bacterium]|nr:threonine synthase [Clostridia bacterium]